MEQQLKISAEQLRANGFTYKQIGEQLSKSATTIRCWLNPDQAEASRRRMRTRYADPEWRQADILKKKQAYWSSLEHRCIQKLRSCKCKAVANSYAPCTATVSELVDAYTGKCHSCGVSEQDLIAGLCMDHNHETGEFRGWLCNPCNKALGFMQDQPQLLVNYLAGASCH